MSAADEAVPWLDDAQLYDWMSTFGLMTSLAPALDAQLKRDAGLNLFEYHVLVRLADAPGHGLPMTDLALVAQGSPSRLSHAVARLEAAGWVERQACATAGRRTAAQLTPAGLKKLEESAPGHVREVRRLVIDVLNPEQLTALGDAARSIIGQIDPGLSETIERRGRREPAPGS